METFAHPISRALREAAVALPEVEEGSSCVNRAFSVRGKNFFFLGEKEGGIYAMVKLKGSLEQAEALGDPRVSVGKFGWVTLRFDPADPPVPDRLPAWVRESFSLLAPKAVARALAGGR